MHLRQQIRDRAVIELTGLTTTGSNVFPVRLFPLAQTTLPALCIFTDIEEIDMSALGPTTLERRMNLVIKGIARQAADIEDVLDNIAEEVEIALSEDLNGLCKACNLVQTSFEFSEEGDNPIGAIQLVYEVMYYTSRADPTTLR